MEASITLPNFSRAWFDPSPLHLTESTLCPSCGFDLGFPAWSNNSGCQEICPSCGIQFGYDDAAGGSRVRRSAIHSEWRAEWVRLGMKWNSLGIPEPEGWDPSMQLIRAGLTQG